LHAASAALNEHAAQLASANDAVAASSKPSTVGAASVWASVAEFSAAYAGRLADRGQSAGSAAGSYTTADDDGAADIGSVSV
jgi:hypothetical protein